jgi:hypothetical protein
LTLSGPATVQSAGRANLTATGRFTDGTVRTVTPVWTSSNPAVATVSAAGVLSAGSVTTDTLVTLTATLTDSGVTVESTLKVTITSTPAVLSSVTLAGASSVQSGGQMRLTLNAQYSDGSTRAVSATGYTFSNASLGSVNAKGVLTVASVNSDTVLTVTAAYSEGGISKSAGLSVNISATPAVLSRLTLIGARGTLASGQTLSLLAEGVYADGSRKAVTATWQATGSAATISATGVLTAKAVTEETPSVVTATYTEAGVTVSAQYQVIVQATEVATPVLAEVETTGTRSDFGLSIWTSLTPTIGAMTTGSSARLKNGFQVAATSPVSYKLFVVAVVPGGGILPNTTIFMLNRNSEWQFAGFPIAEYLAGVADNSFQLVQIFDHLDANLISGTKIFIGYGITDTEMLSSGRFRMVYQVQ